MQSESAKKVPTWLLDSYRAMAGQTFLSGFFTLAVTLNTNRAIGILSNVPWTNKQQCVLSRALDTEFIYNVSCIFFT